MGRRFLRGFLSASLMAALAASLGAENDGGVDERANHAADLHETVTRQPLLQGPEDWDPARDRGLESNLAASRAGEVHEQRGRKGLQYPARSDPPAHPGRRNRFRGAAFNRCRSVPCP